MIEIRQAIEQARSGKRLPIVANYLSNSDLIALHFTV